MKKVLKPLREKMSGKLIRYSDIPGIVYITVLIAVAVAWYVRRYNDDFGMGLMTELIGAAFTLFIIDVLLVRSKTRRWKIVQQHIDYLIARSVNRLRDGIATRAFLLEPKLASGASHRENMLAVRSQRAYLLTDLETLKPDAFGGRISEQLFTEDNYGYFNEKADDIWDILNMKYSEYLAPELVALLMDLHTNLKDLCGHIRQHQKSARFTDQQAYYRSVGLSGASTNLKHAIAILNRLKEEGYSEVARDGAQ